MWFIFFLTPQVQHPAAKMLVLAAQQMEQEVGDGTNFVMVFAGALLQYAEDILRMVSNNIAITVPYLPAIRPQRRIGRTPDFDIKKKKKKKKIVEDRIRSLAYKCWCD